MRQHPARNQPLGRCIGLVAVAAEAAPQLAAVRLAAGLRWTGALRSAVVLERLSWAGAEGELIGGRAAWQGYRANSFSAGMLGTGARGATDYGIQVGANLLTGDSDPYRNVNILESGMSALGLRPAVIGFGSAAINLNSRGYLKTVFHPDHDHRVYPASFFAQALLGTVIGSSGSALEARPVGTRQPKRCRGSVHACGPAPTALGVPLGARTVPLRE